MPNNPVQLMTQVLGATFKGPSWDPWRTVLRAAFALPLTDAERELVEQLTQRQTLPTAPVRELWLLLGRRSGKSIVAALLAVWATTCRTYSLAPGEVGTFMVVASDRRQGRVIKRYVAGLLRSHPSLETLILRETKEAIWLTNGLVVEIHTCSYRSVRGFTCIGATCDEVAFWDAEDSANPDKDVLIALKAAMASVPEAMLIALTSVYARRGEVWRAFEKHFGNNESADTLVVNGPTQTMNPTIDARIIASAYEDDPQAADAEYGSVFRSDVAAMFPLDALEAVRQPRRLELPFDSTHLWSYVAFVDPAGGTGADSMTMAIAHLEKDRAILDLVREVRPPFSPEATVKEFADLLRTYGLTQAVSDRYAGSWPTEAFRKAGGITIIPSERTRSEIYLSALPMVMSGQVELIDHPRLFKQLGSLERRKGRSGKDTVDAPPGKNSHEDVANAAMGALVEAGLRKQVYEPTYMKLEGW